MILECGPADSITLHQKINQMNIEDWQDRIEIFANDRFPNATKETIMNHLKDELIELEESNDPVEIADCIFLLIHYAIKLKCNLSQVMIDKFEVIKKRTYETELNERGYYRHVEKDKTGL